MDSSSSSAEFTGTKLVYDVAFKKKVVEHSISTGKSASEVATYFQKEGVSRWNVLDWKKLTIQNKKMHAGRGKPSLIRPDLLAKIKESVDSSELCTREDIFREELEKAATDTAIERKTIGGNETKAISKTSLERYRVKLDLGKGNAKVTKVAEDPTSHRDIG